MNNTTPEPTTWQRSTTRRFLRWLFRWRTLRAFGFVVFCLVTLAVLVVAEENWRGHRAWDRFRQEWEAKGEHFDLAWFVPKPVPAEQNFAMTPLLAPLLDYKFVNGKMELNDSNGVQRVKGISIYLGENPSRRSASLGNWQRGQFCDLKGWQAFYQGNTDYPASPQPLDAAQEVLFALQKYDSVFAELRAASQRPYAAFPVHYDDGFGLLVPHLSVVKGLAQVVQLRALANLEAGRSEDALRDVTLGLYFATSLQSEPVFISHLVGISIIQMEIQPIWEGLVRHRWTDAQLEKLQKTLGSFHLLEGCDFAMRGERACTDQGLDQLRAGRIPGWEVPHLIFKLIPNGWFYQNQLTIDRAYQEDYLPMVDAAQHRVYPERCGTNALALLRNSHSPYTYCARMMMPDFVRSSRHFARGQTAIDEAVIACGLERYRLANGQLPDTLAGLVPRFIEKVPGDILDGQPLRYHPKPDGCYILYSVGWNKTDDGGEIVLNKGTTPGVDPSRGDWVWACPAQ